MFFLGLIYKTTTKIYVITYILIVISTLLLFFIDVITVRTTFSVAVLFCKTFVSKRLAYLPLFQSSIRVPMILD